MTLPILLSIAEIFGLFTIGGIARRLGYINEQDIDRWTRLVLDFFMPLFTFSSIVNNVNRGQFGELWLLPFIGLGQVLLATGAGFLFQFALLGPYKGYRRTFLHFCAFNNYTYLPVIIFHTIWGESSLSTLFLMAMGSGIGVWTVGVAVLSAKEVKSAARHILTPNLVAIVASLSVALTTGNSIIPKLVMNVLKNAGSVAVPLIIILSGASLMKRGTLRMTWPVVYISIVRLVVLPFLVVPLLSLLPVSRSVYEAAVIIALMPVAMATVVMTRRYGGKTDYAVSAAFVTTLCSAVTAPLLCRFFLH